MEDVARLAVIEQTINDVSKFSKVLNDLLEQIDQILKNPQDMEKRTLKTYFLEHVMQHDVFCEYLKYIGFLTIQGKYVFPKEQSLSKLRMAQAAIERKISICYGAKNKISFSKVLPQNVLKIKPKLKPVNLVTNNDFIRKIQSLFNTVLQYEDERLQAKAREQIPFVLLQVKAIERVRDHQEKLKSGKITGNDLSFEIALLMELLGWFKYQFFTWVDNPSCDNCGGQTVHHNNQIMNTATETYRVEIYNCDKCGNAGGARFPRYNNAETLLQTRRGRCGEWANCFTLLCRALGFDTRYVYDTTDHVWCEVYDQANGTWLHVDPCECAIDAPLMYCCGWNKRISYVVAVSRDDVQDVTWRYATPHRSALARRDLCNEAELVSALITLRTTRQLLVSEARRKYLLKRTLKELVQMMVEREPGDAELGGRISGAASWRKSRGETPFEGYTFAYSKEGFYTVEYCVALDRYSIYEGSEFRVVKGHAKCAYECSVFRKVERDWGQVYLAREEGEEKGVISWRFLAAEGYEFEDLMVSLEWAQFGEGKVDLSVRFDSMPPTPIWIPPMGYDSKCDIAQRFKEAIFTCRLCGGAGPVAWQDAQLFRQEADGTKPTLRLETRLMPAPKVANPASNVVDMG